MGRDGEDRSGGQGITNSLAFALDTGVKKQYNSIISIETCYSTSRMWVAPQKNGFAVCYRVINNFTNPSLRPPVLYLSRFDIKINVAYRVIHGCI